MPDVGAQRRKLQRELDMARDMRAIHVNHMAALRRRNPDMVDDDDRLVNERRGLELTDEKIGNLTDALSALPAAHAEPQHTTLGWPVWCVPWRWLWRGSSASFFSRTGDRIMAGWNEWDMCPVTRQRHSPMEPEMRKNSSECFTYSDEKGWKTYTVCFHEVHCHDCDKIVAYDLGLPNSAYRCPDLFPGSRNVPRGKPVMAKAPGRSAGRPEVSSHHPGPGTSAVGAQPAATNRAPGRSTK